MLTSLKNPWIKELRKLHQVKYRKSSQQFLVEGTHLIQEAIAADYPLEAVCATPHWQAQHASLWQQLQHRTKRQEAVSDEILQGIATTKTPDGVVAIAPYQEITLPHTMPHLGIVLESIQDPGNLGTLIRTAAAVNSDGLWLTNDSVDLAHPKVLRASAGQWFRVSKQVTHTLPAQLSTWQQQGCQVLATASAGAVAYWDINFAQPTVLVMGNEGGGLSPETLSQANHTIAIPMAASVESLNVGVAAAVILFEAVRQRQ
ncbi:RNA methyltransferase [Oscillatoria sp. CS-180]|uniref:TrmH family RNA methyltransferase n=1 Tax=Oscillatoria sp. CS-180 TaxID=3021720 RepID=UPI00232CEC65|nr:RNA methyltransferase [Oscillatoria sp. CS-180]MDB9525030.1 RNA methyltransferase [Oscillatoria sp. CS-180]